MAFTPHPHQVTIFDEARAAIKQHKAVLIQSATGSGKTVIGTMISDSAYQKGRTVMFTVHRDFLVEQTSAIFNSIGLDHGIIAAGFTPNVRSKVQIASIDTLKHRLDRVPRPDLIIVDECHHALAAGWSKVLDHFMSQGTRVIGLTATPWRLSGEGLGKRFSHMVTGPSVRWLIDNGFLCDYQAFAPFTPDLSGVHSREGDFVRSEVELVVDKPTLTGDAINHYIRLASGKLGVAFCVSVKHSQHVAAQFCDAGIRAVHLDSNTPREERRKTIAAFRRREITILTSVDIFGEGFDLPAIEAAILLRPTKSLSLHMQQIGRALRVAPGKDKALILDHAGNLMRPGLGLPDTEIEWSLDDLKKRKKSEAGIPMRQCEACYAVYSPPVALCPYCGHLHEVNARKIEEVAGDLKEITKEMAAKLAADRKKEVFRAKTLDQLQTLAEQRGYSPNWAQHVFDARAKAEQRRVEGQAQAFLRLGR